jgi:hypothetical protein
MGPVTEYDRECAAAAECQRRGDRRGAILALYRALAARREDLAVQQMLCRLVFENPSLFVPPAPGAGMAPPLVSVVTCSIDRARFERVKTSYARAFGAAPWELVGIHDARSLAEGYARGFAKARGEAVVFSHDDIEILSPDLGGSLSQALAVADVVGVVGATSLAGPAFAWGGKAATRGWIAEPAKGHAGVDLVVFNPVPGVATGLAAIDGVFMAARREAVEAIGFDAATFDGFHLYDLDFSYRARLAGLGVAVAAPIVIRHDSAGGFDERWEAYAGRFLAKFPEVRGERARNFMSRIPFPGPNELVAFCRRLEEAGRQALRL